MTIGDHDSSKGLVITQVRGGKELTKKRSC